MSLNQDIRDQMKAAMIAHDAVRLSVLRGLIAAFTYDLVAKKRKVEEGLSDEEVLEIISKQARQRKDSIEQFEKGGRSDLADSEKAELLILSEFLPTQMTKDEVTEFIKQKIAESEPIDPTKKGQFMGLIMKDLKGKVDGPIVKEVIDSLIA